MNYIPTLSSIGWTNNPSVIADYLMSCFVTCHQSMTTLFYGKITSMQYLLKQDTGKPLQLESDLRTALERLYNTAFGNGGTSVLVSVTVDDPNYPARYTIRFKAYVTVDGTQVSVGRLIYTENGRVVSIANANNG